jgi:N-glycosylase/DNA lyase
MIIRLNPSCPFNLDFTLCCGQTFRWDKHGDWWYGVAGEKVFRIRQTPRELRFDNVNRDFVEDYFRLHDNLSIIFSQIKKDKHIEAAVSQFLGLRILHQEPWECLVSYICATYKSIAAIKGMLFNLSRKLGEEVRFGNQIFFTFPAPARLAKASASELTDCGLGYRTRYVSETAKRIHKEDFDLETLRKAKYEEAREQLMSFPGVGPKVADCVLLFSIGKLDAFPVDVWMKRVILRYYASHLPKQLVKKVCCQRSLSDTEYEKLNSFGRKYFGEYAGYAQEYLYHYERVHSKSAWQPSAL